MTGKSKCKILKDIRRQIAAENDIAYVTAECRYQGECSGTCPKCESELRYLERELEKRQQAGKAIVVAGVAAALMVGVSGCVTDGITAGVPEDLPMPGETAAVTTAGVPTEETVVLMGDMPYVPEDTQEVVMGEMLSPTE